MKKMSRHERVELVKLYGKMRMEELKLEKRVLRLITRLDNLRRDIKSVADELD